MPRSRRLILLLAVLAVCTVMALLVVWRGPGRSNPDSAAPLPGLTAEASRKLMAEVQAMEARETALESTTWAAAISAQHHGEVLDRFWDAFNSSDAAGRWELVGNLAPEHAVIPQWAEPEDRGHGVKARAAAGAVRRLDQAAWKREVKALASAGWECARVELRHMAFAPKGPAGLPRSTYAVQLWLQHAATQRRWLLTGDVVIDWSAATDPGGTQSPRLLDASGLRLLTRQGPLPFRESLFRVVHPPERSHFVDPLLVHDLEGDGKLEIILAAANVVFRLQPDGSWKDQPLLERSPGLIFTAALGDCNGDGLVDLLFLRAEGLWLACGVAGGGFEAVPRLVWAAPERIRYGQVLALGDADQDGDLDVWLGQYKPPYERGQMPTPYYDALDGYPSFYLVNDGTGRYRDGTADAGLAARRIRRTYAASWVDLDGNGTLDLWVTSDFAGVDFYTNDGRGHFRDATRLVPERHGFGMGHTLADFNRDGRLDVLVTGMHCPAARRLESLRLVRPGGEAMDAYRDRMTQGNRLYLGGAEGFSPATPSVTGAALAHTGWSWSCPAADFDNDGQLDVYIANGHESRQSTVDYDSEFWMHDIHVGTSADNLALAAYFGVKMGRTRGQGQSYGGYEANRLLFQRAGLQFEEAGWLFGVAVEQDSRNAVAADLDADGRVDLAVTTFEAWPEVRQTLRVFRNQLEVSGGWIGFQLVAAPGAPVIGSQLRVETEQGVVVHPVVTGDSHRTQSPWSVHLGLGSARKVRLAQVQGPGGHGEMVNPEVGKYHHIMLKPPARSAEDGR